MAHTDTQEKDGVSLLASANYYYHCLSGQNNLRMSMNTFATQFETDSSESCVFAVGPEQISARLKQTACQQCLSIQENPYFSEKPESLHFVILFLG